MWRERVTASQVRACCCACRMLPISVVLQHTTVLRPPACLSCCLPYSSQHTLTAHQSAATSLAGSGVGSQHCCCCGPPPLHERKPRPASLAPPHRHRCGCGGAVTAFPACRARAGSLPAPLYSRLSRYTRLRAHRVLSPSTKHTSYCLYISRSGVSTRHYIKNL